MAEWNTTRQRLMLEGLLRVGRRTPQTLYASFSDDLDDRTTNYPVGFVAEEDLSRFIAEAVQEKLARARRPADPEAWFADQLAQLPTLPDVSVMVRDGWGMTPESVEFTAVQKLAQEYGEMCAARALEGTDVHVEYSPEMPMLPAEVRLVSGKLVVRPK